MKNKNDFCNGKNTDAILVINEYNKPLLITKERVWRQLLM